MPKARLPIEIAEDEFALKVNELKSSPEGLKVFESLLKALAELKSTTMTKNSPSYTALLEIPMWCTSFIPLIFWSIGGGRKASSSTSEGHS